MILTCARKASISHKLLVGTASHHHFSNEVGMIDTIQWQFSSCGDKFWVESTDYASATPWCLLVPIVLLKFHISSNRNHTNFSSTIMLKYDCYFRWHWATKNTNYSYSVTFPLCINFIKFGSETNHYAINI